jgi:hypothetical protein
MLDNLIAFARGQQVFARGRVGICRVFVVRAGNDCLKASAKAVSRFQGAAVNPWRNVRSRSEYRSGDALLRKPITGIGGYLEMRHKIGGFGVL